MRCRNCLLPFVENAIFFFKCLIGCRTDYMMDFTSEFQFLVP
uniref:Uncharacterized protein n=1 Tax=Rhizophora mucronata TaxID=61149 RepID=A0A2P2PIY1_RHIMU